MTWSDRRTWGVSPGRIRKREGRRERREREREREKLGRGLKSQIAPLFRANGN